MEKLSTDNSVKDTSTAWLLLEYPDVRRSILPEPGKLLRTLFGNWLQSYRQLHDFLWAFESKSAFFNPRGKCFHKVSGENEKKVLTFLKVTEYK